MHYKIKQYLSKCIDNDYIGYFSVLGTILLVAYYGIIKYHDHINTKTIFFITMIGTAYFACREVGIIYLKFKNYSFHNNDDLFSDKKRGLAIAFIISLIYVLFAPSS